MEQSLKHESEANASYEKPLGYVAITADTKKPHKLTSCSQIEFPFNKKKENKRS